MPKSKSQAHLLDAGNGKFSALLVTLLYKLALQIEITDTEALVLHSWPSWGWLLQQKENYYVVLTPQTPSYFTPEASLSGRIWTTPCFLDKALNLWQNLVFSYFNISFKMTTGKFLIIMNRPLLQVPGNTNRAHMKFQSSLTSGRSLNPVHREIHPYYWC